MEFQDKFIAFVDILGFKSLVEASESGAGIPLSELTSALADMGKREDRATFKQYGPVVCPLAPHIKRDLDFRVLQISDCVIASAEVSPAGVINLVHHCWGAVLRLLKRGLLCRGYITRGSIYHTDDQVIGTGYQDALAREATVAAFKTEADERGTPFVEIDPSVQQYVSACGDGCVQERFSRFTKTDGELVALFPFQSLVHSFTIGGWSGTDWNPTQEKGPNKNVRKLIETMRTEVLKHAAPGNERATKKIDHYVRCLDQQLRVCDATDRFLDGLCDDRREME